MPALCIYRIDKMKVGCLCPLICPHSGLLFGHPQGCQNGKGHCRPQVQSIHNSSPKLGEVALATEECVIISALQTNTRPPPTGTPSNLEGES